MKKIYKILLVAFFLRLALAFFFWHPDVLSNADWGTRFWIYGPASFYQENVWAYTWPNQPPGTIYIFAGIKKLAEVIFGFFWFLNINIAIFPSKIMFFLESNLYLALLHLPGILADGGIAYLIYYFFKKKKLEKVGIFGAIAFLVNPVIWYNSSIWGQTDAVINFFALLAFILLLEKRLIWATLALVLSFYIKASLFIFTPAFLIIALRQRYNLRQILSAISVASLAIIILTLPFATGSPVSWLIALYKDKVFSQQLQVITANAFNLWAMIAGIHEKPQSLLLGPVSYRTWGTALFGLFCAPTVYLVFKKQDWSRVFWALAVISFASFTLLTNMHERYLYPFLPVLTILVAKDRKLWSYLVILSGINLLNLYNFWWVPKVNFLVEFLSARDRLMPRILGLVVTGIFLLFYRRFLQFVKSESLNE